jgi:uncharacterized delta-60 repeat protein
MWSLIRRTPQLKKSLRCTPYSVRLRLEALEDRCLLSAPGTLDTTFGNGGTVTTAVTKGNDSVGGVLLQSNGDIIAYGSGSSSFALARYTPSGSLDSTFGSGGIVTTSFGNSGDGIQQAILLSDGKILAAGHSHVVRYNSNGSLDTTFGSNGVLTLPTLSLTGGNIAVLIQPMSDGSDDIVFGTNTSSGIEMQRYTPSGALDTSFGTGGTVSTNIAAMQNPVFSLALDSNNGDILAGGTENGAAGGSNAIWVTARYTPNGSLDTTFNPNSTQPGVVTTQVGINYNLTEMTSLLVTPDDKIVAVGRATGGSPMGFALVRYNADGSLDSTFGGGTGIVISSFPNTPTEALGVTLQSDGEIVVAGSVFVSPYRAVVGVYNPDGSPDTTFGSGGFVFQSLNSGAWAGDVAVQPTDGKIVVAGTTIVATHKSTKEDFFLARYIGTTTPTTTTTLAAAAMSSNRSAQPPAPALPQSTTASSDFTLPTDSVFANWIPTLATSTHGSSPSTSSLSAFPASGLSAIEQDISQWEEAMTKELTSLIQTIDQLFADWQQMVLDSLAANPTLLH